MSCKINYTKSGVAIVKDSQGNPSTLFPQLVEYTNNQEEAIDMVVMAYTNEFRDTTTTPENQEPTLNEVLRYMDIRNSIDSIPTLEDNLEISAIMRANGFEYIQELDRELTRVFKPNGFLELDYDRIANSSLYNEVDAQNIINDDEVSKKVKDIVTKVSGISLRDENFYVNESVIDNDYKMSQISTKFGTNKKVEDSELEQAIIETTKGIKIREDFDLAIQDLPFNGVVREYNSNPTYADSIYEKYSKVVKINIAEISEGVLVAKKLNSQESLLKSTLLVLQDNNKLTKEVNDFLVISDEVKLLNPVETKEVIKEIETEAVNLSIDIIGLSEKPLNKVTELLNELINLTDKAFLNNVTTQDIVKYSEKHQEVFNIENENEVSYEFMPEGYEKLGNIVKLETELDTETLFNNFGLIKIAENVYHRVDSNTSIDTVYEFLFRDILNQNTLLPKGLIKTKELNNPANKPLVLEELKSFINSREVGLKVNDMPTREKISLYQVAFKHKPLSSTINNVNLNTLSKITTNPLKLKTDFISKFYKYMLQEKLKNSVLYREVLSNFEVNNKDLTLKRRDNAFMDKLRANIDNIKYGNELLDYASLKREDLINDIQQDNGLEISLTTRAKVRNNPSLLQEYNGGIIKEDDLYIIQTSDSFIKQGGKVYERVGNNVFIDITIPTEETYNNLELEINYNQSKVKQLENENVNLKTEKKFESIEEFNNFVNEKLKFQIIGEKGASRINEYNNKLNLAKSLDKQGYGIDSISNQTGWYKSPDGWKYLSKEVIKEFKIINSTTNTVLNLKEVLGNENTLFKIYPEMGEVKVVFIDDNSTLPEGINSLGKFNLGDINMASKTIRVATQYEGKQRTLSEMQNTLGHEISHYGQQIEGFSGGGNLQSILDESVVTILNLDVEDMFLKDIPAKIKSADKTGLSENQEKIVYDSLMSIQAILSGDREYLFNQYRHILGEIDANIVGQLSQRGSVIGTYGDLLSAYMNVENINPKNIYLLSNGKIQFQIIGEQGATNLDKVQETTFRMDNLGVARDMELSGKTPLEIRLATGWEKGTGKWKYEILDGLVKDTDLNFNTNDINFENKVAVKKLTDVYENNDLFEAYPILRDSNIVVYETSNFLDENKMFAYGNDIYVNKKIYGTKDNKLELNKWADTGELQHEIQHLLQSIEGFAKGSSREWNVSAIERAVNFIRKGDGNNDKRTQREREYDKAFESYFRTKVKNADEALSNPNIDAKLIAESSASEMYKRVAGDVEARNVQERLNMSLEDRRQTLLATTQEVANEDQVFLDNYISGLTKGVTQTPQEIVQSLVEKLSQGGLSKSINLMTQEELQKVLEELGVDATLAKQIIAWHGSPYQFNKFELSKIGTGEGAQAFGWGLYFTDLESIARDYAEKLGGVIEYDIMFNGQVINPTHPLYYSNLYNVKNKKEALEYVNKNKPSNNLESKIKQKAIEFLEKLDSEEFSFKANQVKGNKNLYKVSLHQGKQPGEYTWLEWDKSINESQKEILFNNISEKSLKGEIHDIKISDRYDADSYDEWKTYRIGDTSKMGEESEFTETIYSNLRDAELEVKRLNFLDTNIKGLDFYEALAKEKGQKKASLFLLENGIDGIKYPAESVSRGATSDTARGFNYVVFDENAVMIEEQIQFQKELSEKGINPTVAGFVNQKTGDVYIDKNNPNIANTLIHEHGHLLLTDLEVNNPDLYQASVGLINKNKSEAVEYIDYVKNTQPNLKEGTREFDQEVLAQVIGDNGARLLESKKQNSIKEWLSDFWSFIKESLGLSDFTIEQVRNMTLKEFGEVASVSILKGEQLVDTNTPGSYSTTKKLKDINIILNNNINIVSLQNENELNSKINECR